MTSTLIPTGIGIIRGSEPKLVLVIDDRVISVADALRAVGREDLSTPNMRDLIEDWDTWQSIITETSQSLHDDPSRVEGWVDADSVTFDPPVLSDAMLVFTAANYAAHTSEAESSEKVGQKVTTGSSNPYVFLKPMRSVIGPTDDVVKPHDVEQLDWEVELAVVIGKEGRRIPVENAMEYVAAYLLCNDVSARDFVRREDWPMFSSDWFAQKSFDTFTPMGPVLVPASLVPNPDELRLQLWVGDELMQDGVAGDMIFSIAEQISYASRFATLKPGDVISTGTPSGVGMARNRYLHAGETMTVVIPGLGRQQSLVISE